MFELAVEHSEHRSQYMWICLIYQYPLVQNLTEKTREMQKTREDLFFVYFEQHTQLARYTRLSKFPTLQAPS